MIFFDKDQLVVIKVFPTPELLEREILGSKSLSKTVIVPKVEKLDQTVAKISLLPGFLGYQIGEELDQMVANFLINIKPVKIIKRFSILTEIAKLKKVLNNNPELFKIEKALVGKKLFPVHGDLQKQNIIISGNKLGLIDFEHFSFAPRELEIVNSLFFNDGNCLDISNIVKFLPRGFFDQEMIKTMLKFYTFRQISLGMKEDEAKQRLKLALIKVNQLKISRKPSLRLGITSSLCYL